MRLARIAALVAVVVLASGCSDEGTRVAQPREGRAGLHLAGTVGGRQVAISDGSPDLLLGNCDPRRGVSRDLCFVGRDIDGGVVGVLIRNPDVVEEGVTLPVVRSACTGRACGDVTDGVVVDVRIGQRPLQRVRAGQVRFGVAQFATHYAGSLRLTWPRGSLSGDFDVLAS